DTIEGVGDRLGAATRKLGIASNESVIIWLNDDSHDCLSPDPHLHCGLSIAIVKTTNTLGHSRIDIRTVRFLARRIDWLETRLEGLEITCSIRDAVLITIGPDHAISDNVELGIVLEPLLECLLRHVVGQGEAGDDSLGFGVRIDCPSRANDANG